LIIVGLLFKVAAAPFHNWSIDVYDGVPSLVTAWLTTMPKISLLLFILEFQGFAFLSNWSTWTLVLLVSTILSFIFGSLGGLAQYRIKRLLAYSTISHVGFILFALSINTINSIEAFLFYLIQYSLTNVNVFFIVIAFGYLLPIVSIYSPVQLIGQLKGQISANLILSLSLAICLFSLMGIPPIIGFFAKIMVLMAALYNGYYFLSIVAILFSVVSAVYYLMVIKVVNFDKYTPDTLNNPDDNNLRYLKDDRSYPGNISFVSSITIAILTLLIILFLLNPNLLLHSLHHLALSLFTI
jgi:NADH-ubiquinone oxidoreductase chain 2